MPFEMQSSITDPDFTSHRQNFRADKWLCTFDVADHLLFLNKVSGYTAKFEDSEKHQVDKTKQNVQGHSLEVKH